MGGAVSGSGPHPERERVGTPVFICGTEAAGGLQCGGGGRGLRRSWISGWEQIPGSAA